MGFKSFLLCSTFAAIFSSSSANSAYICPYGGEDPIEVDVGDQDLQNIQLRRSTIGSVCMLSYVIPGKEGVDLSSRQISINDPNSDYKLIPISRSYDNGDWTRVAGAFASSVEMQSCDELSCDLEITFPQSMNRNGKAVLLAFEHALKNEKEELSRFLIQTTFGPTKDMIDGWVDEGYSHDISGYTKWVDDQMDPSVVSPTYHREYYRQFSDFKLFKGNVQDGHLGTIHPCKQFSRWIDYTFDADDLREEFDVISLPSGQYLITLGGVPRSVVYSFEAKNGSWKGEGKYAYCDNSKSDNVGKEVYVRAHWAKDCQKLKGGNPMVRFTDEVINNSQYSSGLDVLKLPGYHGFDILPGKLLVDREEERGNKSYRLKEGMFDNAKCSGLGRVFTNVVGRVDGDKYFRYAAYGVFGQNTVESPSSGGGLSEVAEGAHFCSNVPKNFQNINSCSLSDGVSCYPSSFTSEVVERNSRVLVCGSAGEVLNSQNLPLSQTETFHPYRSSNHKVHWYNLPRQRGNVWFMVNLTAKDQLRQRVAWALSEVLVISTHLIPRTWKWTEIFLSYNDIFVRHAFGNYKDILREVAYSPMMGEFLSHLGNKKAFGNNRPDENFSRELMQLFTVGTKMLNIDGTEQQVGGSHIPTYNNADIRTFARAWTGFDREYRRGNLEGYWFMPNRVDPMLIDGKWRDPFPKADLLGGYIGDKYPLCIDLPKRQFLRKGAVYRLQGSWNMPEVQYDPPSWKDMDRKYFELVNVSGLFQYLCNSNDISGTCDFRPEIYLNENLSCRGHECKVENVRLVKVQDVYYEYVRPACIELSFHKTEDLKLIVDTQSDTAMCLHRQIDDIAHDACCRKGNTVARNFCKFSGQRKSFDFASDQCKADDGFAGMCAWDEIFASPPCRLDSLSVQYHWTDQSCETWIGVRGDGMIKILHRADIDDQTATITDSVAWNNDNWFKVNWENGAFPKASISCENTFHAFYGCKSSVIVQEVPVFSSIPTYAEAVELSIGFQDLDSFDTGTYILAESGDEIHVYHRHGWPGYSIYTIFKIEYKGAAIYLRNVESMVTLTGTSFKLRNPPHMVQLAFGERRDAIYETEAILDHLLFHPNTAPFLAHKMIQKLGISNPSPDYVSRVATAFKEGSINFGTTSFGNGRYGSMSALVASIVLDIEARAVVLDADPSHGSVRENIVKLVHLLRALNFTKRTNENEIRIPTNLFDRIGQSPYMAKSVFSFFRPEYATVAMIDSKLVAPESQILTSPSVVSFLNGITSLLSFGLTACFQGFGEITTNDCNGYIDDTSYKNERSRGSLILSFGNDDSVVDELAMLLTGGRLNSSSRTMIEANFAAKNNPDEALRYAAKALIATAEFHVTNLFHPIANFSRPDVPVPSLPQEEYKAIVYVMLRGGLDTMNLLVPYSGCKDGKDMYEQYRSVRGIVAVDKEDLLEIDASSSQQVCRTFGVHKSMSVLRDLYNENDLQFFANVGAMPRPTTKSRWQEDTKASELFAHNTQEKDVQTLDRTFKPLGTGIGGRMIDALSEKGFKTGSVSIAGPCFALDSKTTKTLIVPESGYPEFDPARTWTGNYSDIVMELNKESSLGSSLYGDIWAETSIAALNENHFLYSKYTNAELSTQFPKSSLGNQFKAISKMIKIRKERGIERDILYAEKLNLDMHANINAHLPTHFNEINSALKSLKEEMKAQGMWNQVNIVFVSEFGRTLQPNTANGTDHAWGANYFMAGGALDGGKILGKYPADLTEDSPLVIEGGIIIPTLSWESIWNGIGEWFGVEGNLDQILPNRRNFNSLHQGKDLFLQEPSPTPSNSPTSLPSSTLMPSARPSTQPSISPTIVPSLSPTIAASTGPSTQPSITPTSAASIVPSVKTTNAPSDTQCLDSPLNVEISDILRNCNWVKQMTNWRCQKYGIKSHCPITCNSLEECTNDTLKRFQLPDNSFPLRTCRWVSEKLHERCTLPGVRHSCRETCG